jgi:hypothetical protein
MNFVKKVLLAVALATAVFAQSPEPPIADTRFTVHTLVREDIFAGFLNDDLERLARGEKNAQRLAETRTAEKSSAVAWQAGVALYRAVVAFENKKPEDGQKHFDRSQELFAQAKQLNPRDGGAAAVTGGSYVVFADRLPKDKQAAAWQASYEAFSMLWQFQKAGVERLPIHIRGELLGGLAVSAQRTGHTQEVAEYVDRILEVMPDTPYGKIAKQWKENPASAKTATITCLNCHESGRLAVRLKSEK